MNMLNISIWTPWLLASIILYIFAGVLWLVAVYLQLRMKNMALEVQRKEAMLGKEYFLLVKYWVILGGFSFLAMGSVFVFMIFKS